MSETARQIAKMVNMLPFSEQDFAFEIIKKLVIAWDPNFNKLTPDEAKELKIAGELDPSEYIDETDSILLNNEAVDNAVFRQ